MTIYIGVPNLQTLYRRQFKRDPGAKKEVVVKRMKQDWQDWQNYQNIYDKVIINEDGKLERAVGEVIEFIQSR